MCIETISIKAKNIRARPKHDGGSGEGGTIEKKREECEEDVEGWRAIARRALAFSRTEANDVNGKA